MTPLLRLYPPAWRERYLDEMAALLAERPAGIRDRIDLVRGALDAWLHPQVRSAARPDDQEPVMRPIGIAVLAVLGGGLWVGGGIVQHVGGLDPVTGYKESTGVMVVSAGMLVTTLAAIGLAWSQSAGWAPMRRAAIGMLVFTFLMPLPWPILALGFFGYVFSTVAFGAQLWLLARQRVGVLLAIGAFVGASFNTESAMALAGVPFGLAWAVVGLSALANRGHAGAAA